MELHLTGQALPEQGLQRFYGRCATNAETGVDQIYLLRAACLGFLLVFFLLPVIGQVVWFLFTSWMMAIQYCDYPYDNHKISFANMRSQLRGDLTGSYSFGITVSIASMVPFLNLLVMPVAVCGATAMWVDRYKQSHYPR